MESVVTHWSVNTMTLFEAGPIGQDQLRKAFDRVIDKYPYLSMRVEKTCQDEAAFVEADITGVWYDIEWNSVESEAEFNDWQKRLNLFGAKRYPSRVFNFQVDVYQSRTYRLYFALNHAGRCGLSRPDVTVD